MADWKQRARKRMKEKQSGNTFKLVAGTNIFRILPNAKGEEYPPYFEYLVHREVGPDNKFCRCGKSVKDRNGECWLCDVVIPKLAQSSKRSKQALAKLLEPKEQFIVQVATYEPDSEEFMGPKTWYVPTGGAKSLSVSVLGLLASTRRDYASPKKGRNLSIERTGSGFKDTRYGPIEPDDEPSRVPRSILDNLKPFSQVVPAYDEDKQRAAYYGRSEEETRRPYDDDEEDDYDMAKAKKKSKNDEEVNKKKKGRKVEDDDEEEEEEDDDVEEEDDDEDEPKKKGKKKSKKDDDEDEEEDEDDDEDDEPVKKKKAGAAKSKKSKKDDDEDEEEEDEEEDEDDDEDDEPKKKKGKKSKSDEDDEDEDEEEEDEEEDEDDDEPKKKGKKPAKKPVAKSKKKSKK